MHDHKGVERLSLHATVMYIYVSGKTLLTSTAGALEGTQARELGASASAMPKFLLHI